MKRKARSIHLIEKKPETQFLRRVDGEPGVWQTAYWVIGKQTRADLLENGSVYVHKGQLLPSHAGGRIRSIEHELGIDPRRYVIKFRSARAFKRVLTEKAGWGNEKKIDWEYRA